MFFAYLSILGVLLLAPGCSDDEARVVTKDELWEWIGHHLHQGMPIDAATAVMEKAGFACETCVKTKAKIFDPHNKVTEGTYDFVKCEREDGSPPILKRWIVTLVQENGVLKMIGVRGANVYPGHEQKKP